MLYAIDIDFARPRICIGWVFADSSVAGTLRACYTPASTYCSRLKSARYISRISGRAE